MTKEDAIKLLREYFSEDMVWDIVDVIAKEEREECAKFFTENDTNLFWGSQVASLIRARGQE